MGARGIQKQIMKYYRQAKIAGASVHSLRHTIGAHHTLKGSNLRTLQEIMGHKDIRTTEAYVSLAKKLAKKEWRIMPYKPRLKLLQNRSSHSIPALINPSIKETEYNFYNDKSIRNFR
jgi:hypothetical protein